MTPVLIGISAFFWRVEAQKQGTNRFQVYIIFVFQVGFYFTTSKKQSDKSVSEGVQISWPRELE